LLLILCISVLKGAGYSAEQVGDALHTTFHCSLDQTKKALVAAGFMEAQS